MDVITIDFESFYDKDYSLSKMSTMAYVLDKRFEVIGVGVKVNDEETKTYTGSKMYIAGVLAGYNWKDSYVLAHNTLFDATILSHCFGVKPKMWLDTLSLARALHGTEVGGSLKALAQHYQVGEKGSEVMNALGKRRMAFSEAELAAYMDYCKNDVDLTHALFKRMAPAFNKVEIKLIDLTLRMHTEPKLMLDRLVLEDNLYWIKQKKEKALEDCGITKEELMSNKKFAKVLENVGVEPPMKISPATGKPTYAFAKKDEGLLALLEHPSITVQVIVASRLQVKETLEETKTKRLIEVTDLCDYLPVGLKYYGAEVTGRWSAGGDGGSLQLQNVARDSMIKEAIVAPEGHKIVGFDLSNIEVRVNLYIAGQQDQLDIIRGGRDVYKEFASAAFDIKQEDVTAAQRFIGKTCIAEGELVLTERGLVPIEKIRVDDRVWDGIEWVRHEGVVYMGEKDVIEYQGLRATPDHIVYLEDGAPCEFGNASNKRACIANTGDGGTPLKLLDNNQRGDKKEQQSWRDVVVCAMRLWRSEMDTPWFVNSRIIKKLPQLRAEAQPRREGAFVSGRPGHRTSTATGYLYFPALQQPERQGIQVLRRAWDRVQVRVGEIFSKLLKDSTGVELRERDRSRKQQLPLRAREYPIHYTERAGCQPKEYSVCIMEGGEDSSAKVEGEPIYSAEYGVQICSHGDDRRGDNCDGMGVGGEEMQELERHKSKARVYDILNAGPKHRFTVSNVLVSNCVLGLGFGAGHKVLCKAINLGAKQFGFDVDVDEQEAKRIVDLYREINYKVKAAWYEGDRVLEAISKNEYYSYNPGLLELPVHGAKGILLPSGLFIKYPNLKRDSNEEGKEEWVYEGRRQVRTRIYGPKTTQNITQAVARCVMGEAIVKISKRYPVKLTVHDSCYVVVPEDEAQEAYDFMMTEMTRTPDWAPGLPLAAEGSIGSNLKEAG